MGQASAEQALRALEPLVGEWTVEAKGPDGQAWPGTGRASFQRFIGTISDDARTISGRWEKAENGPEFTVDFYLTYRKVVLT